MSTVELSPPAVGRVQQISALGLVFVPLLALGYAAVAFWDHGIGWLDLILAVSLYLVTGHGLTVGFHRMLTHGSFRPARPLKVALAIAGSMGVEGSVFTWVAQHRRHHAYADREGDPHSPWRYGSGFGPQLKGLYYAHIGWFFASNPSEPERWIPDLLADRDLAFIAVLSLGEGWHNGHHAYPTLARHGVERGQVDSSAALIRGFERLGWATAVQWPSPSRLAARRI